MLVLTRKVEEGFCIGDHIFVKVLAIGQRRVKLGIEAPLESHIVRDQSSSDEFGKRARNTAQTRIRD